MKTRNDEALEEARSITGSNRAGIGNLHESFREVLSMIRVSGVARKTVESSSEPTKKKSSERSSPKKTKPTSSKPKSSQPAAKAATASLEELSQMNAGYEQNADESNAIDVKGLQDELDALDFGDDGDESDLDDDELDLR